MESIHNSQRSSIDFEAQSDHSGTLELVNEKDTTAAAGLPEALLPSNWSNLRKWRSTIARTYYLLTVSSKVIELTLHTCLSLCSYIVRHLR